ncbi:MAG: hypothetical protein LIR50_01150 [Bacillota bacterium]|nr:hypothetical protein [Bacillota bacterium]
MMYWDVIKRESKTGKRIEVIKSFKAKDLDDNVAKEEADNYANHKNNIRILSKKYYYEVECNII